MGFHEEISAFERIVIIHLHHSVGVCVCVFPRQMNILLIYVVCVTVYITRLSLFQFQSLHCYHVTQIMKKVSCTSVELSDFQVDVCLRVSVFAFY